MSDKLGQQSATATLSIRTFLTGVVVTVVVLFSFIAILKGYTAALKTTNSILDEHLKNTAKLLARPVSDETQYAVPFDHFEYQILQSGRVVQHSANLSRPLFSAPVAGYAWANFQKARWRTFSYYVPAHQFWVVVAEPKRQRDSIAEKSAMSAISPMLVGLPVVVVLVWWVITLGLRPLIAFSRALLDKGAEDLQTVSLPTAPQELQPLVANTNALLARLEKAFDHEKHFIAEASHELRTPISTLKVHLHNIKNGNGDAESFQALEAQVDHIARLVDQLLDLSKNQSIHYASHFEKCDLRKLAELECARQYVNVEQKALDLTLDADDVEVVAHPVGITTLLANLIDNAIKYTPRNGSVLITLRREKNHALLQVEDSGPGIPAGDTAITRRFYRGETSMQEAAGVGLGLAIVHSIVEQHRARMTFVRSEALGGLKVSVRIPYGGWA